jgi:hypothetical protein
MDMQGFRKSETAIRLDEQKKALLLKMNEVGVDSEEYPKLLKYLGELTDVEKIQRRAPISMDTIASVVGSLAGIFIIVIMEQRHVMQTRALNMLPRPK